MEAIDLSPNSQEGEERGRQTFIPHFHVFPPPLLASSAKMGKNRWGGGNGGRRRSQGVGGNKYGPGSNKSDWKWPMSDREFFLPPMVSFWSILAGSQVLPLLEWGGVRRAQKERKKCNYLRLFVSGC